MKSLLCSLLLTLGAVALARADIQAPPISNQGPTRKLGRGLSNVVGAITEIPYNMSQADDNEGAMAIPLGVVRGVGRFFVRTGVGLYEMATFPFPLNKEKYTPTLRSDVPSIYGGYSEFPPELGWESRYDYVRR